MKAHAGDKKSKIDLVVARYCYDFGNIVGGQKKQAITFYNVGYVPTSLTVTVPEQKETNLSVKATVEKQKIGPLEGAVLNFNMTVIQKKNKPYVGKKIVPVFVEVRGGPRYQIDFEANVTSPELAFSSEVINFGDVPYGQRKIITVRFENHKDVDCDWSYSFRDEVAAAGRDKKESVPVFELRPSSGKLNTGQKMNVEIIFTPNGKKEYDVKVQPTVKNTHSKPNSIKLMEKVLCIV